MHPSKQHGAKDHLLTATGAGDYLSPGQMTQARQAYSQTAGMCAQPLVQLRRQQHLRLLHLAAIPMHIAQAKGEGGFIDLPEQATEEALMLFLANTQACLRDEI